MTQCRKVFVVGCGRSGTTWTRRILDCHPQVISGPESHVFRPCSSRWPSTG
ncbi:MAG: sulfotransferase [Actinobacteria bacterium]|nr:sulfotransferase [Actinomycetota bacterium]MBW3648957.1 sulfotransferase [Actinomycetota bacterium]